MRIDFRDALAVGEELSAVLDGLLVSHLCIPKYVLLQACHFFLQQRLWF